MSGYSSPKHFKHKAHVNCFSIFTKKIPTVELRWLCRQRNNAGEKSVMQMVHTDQIETMKHRKKKQMRKVSDEEAYQKKIKKLQDEQAFVKVI